MRTKNKIWNYSLIVVGLVLILFNTCEKQVNKQGKYDLFPLKVGNEFYYKYNMVRSGSESAITEGTETWKVVSESSKGNSINYIIERNLNGTRIMTLPLKDTTLITDSKHELQIMENKSTSVISVFGFSFKRYQDISSLDLERWDQIMQNYSCIFKADSGMTKYYYYHPPNQVTKESLLLDSLRTFN